MEILLNIPVKLSILLFQFQIQFQSEIRSHLISLSGLRTI